MTTGSNLTDHFLIAMPMLHDPNFARSVTYICEHSEHGAMGIVINRPLELHLGDILEQMEIAPKTAQIARAKIYNGGPVQTDRGFVLHDGGHHWASTLEITPEISVTTSKDILEAIAVGEGPPSSLIALGYAGWGAGQLEAEISANAWLSGPANSGILFHYASGERWHAAARHLGVDIDLLSGEAGHA